jgi:ABC-2 type transport system permease protein
VEPYVGVAAFLEPHRQNDFRFRQAEDATAMARFGELTAAVTLQVLVPLLIILLTFASIAGEREDGTLTQVLSTGVTPRVLIAGKVLGATWALAVLLVPASVLGCTALLLASIDGAFGASLPRLALMSASYLLYFSVFLALSLAVSILASSSRAALVILLTFWITGGLIAPRVVADATRGMRPTPSAYAFTRQAQEAIDIGLDGQTPAAQRNAALEQRVLREYGVTRIEDLPVSFAGISLEASEAYTTQVYDLYYTRLWDTFDAQNRLQQAAGVFAPALAMRALSMGFAGTDFDHHRRFATAAEAYRRTLVGTMNEDMKQHAGKQDYAYRGGPDLWQRVPAFSYDAPPARWALEHQWLSASCLLAWTIAAWGSLWMAARRLTVA